ncbi:MAG: DUF2066 domain-containing protein [Gammaproteobacteria bacterium]|nr:DUF2066 domain-containing protein [Gammaproteobacteria bacterium]MCH9744509.1 DUF2066 domain-containing protein [Gammaproteobacteria bacterium]
MKKLLPTLLLIFFLISGSFGLARANTHNLYTAELPISDPSYSAVQKVFPVAFANVLVKISGNQQVMTLPQIQNVMSQINQYIQSYSYESKLDQEGNKQLLVKINFDENGINNLLSQANQPIWTQGRLKTLVWLSVDDGQQTPYILSMGLNNALGQALQADVAQRGLKVLLPVLDLQDQNYINTDTTKAFDQQKLLSAAERYGVKVVLAGDIKQVAPQQWQAQWLLLMNNQPLNWSNQASSIDDLVAQGVNNLANIMVNQYAISTNNGLQTQVSLEVLNVNSLNEYVALLKYMRHLSAVSKVDVENMANSTVVLNVTTVGGSQALNNTLSNDDVLKPIPSSLTQGAHAADLYYQWVGQNSKDAS